jgi:hypothetical protein
MKSIKKISIGAIFKNEFEYIVEWLAFHRVIGFEQFFIADNGSNDGSSQLLMALEQAGYITRIYSPTIGGKAPQIPAYKHIISEYADKISYIGFIDCDEFITPESIGINVIDWLESLYQKGEVSAIGLNWSIYGSSGKTRREDKLVIERFSNHAPKTTGVNKHIKSFVRADRFDGFFSPHSVKVSKGTFINAREEIADLDEAKGYSLTKSVCWERVRVNHYVIKSWGEFKEKKQARGRATTSSKRDDSFFANHDLNDCSSRSMWPYIQLVEGEIESIKEAVREKTEFYLTPVMHVDKINESGVKGWLFAVDSREPCQLRIIIDDNLEYIVPANKVRADVYGCMKEKGCTSEVCGFDFSFPKKLRSDSSITIEAYGFQNTLRKKY